jgi:hypothetical protein
MRRPWPTGGGCFAPKINKKYNYRMNTDVHMIVIQYKDVKGCAWNPFVSNYRREVDCCEQGNVASFFINGRDLMDTWATTNSTATTTLQR